MDTLYAGTVEVLEQVLEEVDQDEDVRDDDGDDDDDDDSVFRPSEVSISSDDDDGDDEEEDDEVFCETAPESHTRGEFLCPSRILLNLQLINCCLNSSTIDELGEWCLGGGAESKLNRACKVSMTTL